MIIENGKRYVRANGEISGVIEDGAGREYPRRDAVGRVRYTIEGKVLNWDEPHPLDLVSEYTEPHEYGPWISWAGGECPVADGVMGQVQVDDEKRTEVETEEPDLLHEYNWENIDGYRNIIYYRVLIEEPEAVETTALVHTEPGRDWQQARLAIVTVQGDKLGIEWAPKEDKRND